MSEFIGLYLLLCWFGEFGYRLLGRVISEFIRRAVCSVFYWVCGRLLRCVIGCVIV